MCMPNNLFIMDFETTGLGIFDYTSFPIEIGIVITDNKLNIQETYSSFIRPNDFDSDQTNWNEEELKAYNIHKIEYAEWHDKAIGYNACRQHLMDLADKYTQFTGAIKKIKPIILSDNAVFETMCIRRIFEDNSSPMDYRDLFHYSSWDTNIILTNIIGDPIPAHRALADCGLLYKNLVRAYERLLWFNKSC